MNFRTPFGPCAAALGVLALTGCMTSPADNEAVHNIADPVDFQLYAINPSNTMTIECTDHGGFYNDEWTTVGTFTSPATPYATIKGESVYSVEAHKVIPSACWFEASWASGRVLNTTYVRAFETIKGERYSVAVYDQAGLNCLYSKLFTDGPVTAGQACRKHANHDVTDNMITLCECPPSAGASCKCQ